MAGKSLKDLALKQVTQQASMIGRGLVHDLAGIYHRGYNFYVELNGHGFSFSKASGLENSVQMEELREGGYNYYTHHMRSQASGQHVLTLEYGSTNLNFLLDDIEPGRYFPDGIYLTILDQRSLVSSKIYLLDGCYLQKISYGEMDAERSAIVINRMEIVYSRMVAVTTGV